MRKRILLLGLTGLLVACQPNPQGNQQSVLPFSKGEKTKKTITRDLSQIKKDGVLKVLTVYSGTSYFLYRGQAMGFEYELLQRLADHLQLKLQIVVANDIDELIPMLRRGEADIIAHGLAITQDRKEQVAFTNFLYNTNQVLIQRKPENWRDLKLHEIEKQLITDPIALIGDTVSVRKNSSYFERLQNLQKEIGGQIYIDTLDGSLPTDKIINQVVEGTIKYTIADKNIASINASYHPILDISMPISFSQRIAWAVRKNATDLKDTINIWLTQFKKEVDFPVIYNKYFKNKRSFKKRNKSEFYSHNSDKISPYDDIIREHAQVINWDWRLVSAVIYQESQFDPNSESWVSAGGLMQLMPATAADLGVTDTNDPQQNIRAGTLYLNQLWDQWKSIPDSLQRIKFTLASYNCGLGHVQDAQRLTEAQGGNQLSWDEEVEEQLLNLTYPEYYNLGIVQFGYVRGEEPVGYVDQIFDHYTHYKKLIPL